MRILAFILVFLSTSVSAQTKLDSLLADWKNEALADSVRMAAFEDYIFDGFLYKNPDSAMVLTKEWNRFAKATGSDYWIAESEYTQGMVFYLKGDFIHAIEKFEGCLAIREKDQDQKNVAKACNALAVMNTHLGDHSRAISFYLKALKIQEEQQDTVAMAGTLSNMGLLYKEQADYDRSIELFERSMELWRKMGRSDKFSAALENLGIAYSMKGEFDRASSYLLAALKKKEEAGNEPDLARSLMNIGGHYVKVGKLDSAEIFMQRSLEIAKRLDQNVIILSGLANLGELYRTQGKLDKAISYTEQAHEMALEHGVKDKLKSTSFMLYQLYKLVGKNDEALAMYELHVATRDSLLSEQNQREILRQEYKYQYDKEALTDSLEFAKKEAVMEEHSKKQTLGLFAAGGGLLLLMALAFAIYSGKKKSDELLLNILPEETAKELKQKGHADAQLIENVTVLFSDFKGFTALSEQLSPKELVKDLNECFSAFDRIMEKYEIEKIKTIGDAYMAACGLPSPDANHAEKVIRAAFEMRDFIEEGKARKIAAGLPYFEIRIGVHTGPVVAGIVGIKKFQYDIWGDTVNTASRMESSGEAGKVNISETTYELVKDRFNCEYRGEVEAKGKGKLKMYFVEAAS